MYMIKYEAVHYISRLVYTLNWYKTPVRLKITVTVDSALIQHQILNDWLIKTDSNNIFSYYIVSPAVVLEEYPANIVKPLLAKVIEESDKCGQCN